MTKTPGPWQLPALAGRWALRTLVGYLLLVFGLLAGGAALAAPGSWDRVGGVGNVVVAYLFYTVLMTPAFALIGLVQGAVVWAAARWSGGSRRTCAVAGGASAAVLSTAFVVVSSEPTAWDLVAYAGVGVLLGVLAGWLSGRDCARMLAAGPAPRAPVPPGPR